MRHIWGALAVFATGSASMACPVAGDLTRGIEITFNDGHSSVYTQDANGVLTEKEVQPDGASFNYVTDNGVLETAYYELDSVDGDPQGWEGFRYSFDVGAIVPLAPWSGQSGYQIALDPNGAEIDKVL